MTGRSGRSLSSWPFEKAPFLICLESWGSEMCLRCTDKASIFGRGGQVPCPCPGPPLRLGPIPSFDIAPTAIMTSPLVEDPVESDALLAIVNIDAGGLSPSYE
jgi:hypothetical protein